MPVACQPRVREAQHGGDAPAPRAAARPSPRDSRRRSRSALSAPQAADTTRAAARPRPSAARTAARRRAGTRARRRRARSPAAAPSRASSSSPARWPCASLTPRMPCRSSSAKVAGALVGQQLAEVVEQRAAVAEAGERVVRGREVQLGRRGGDRAVGAPQLDLGHRGAREVLEHAVVAAGPLARLVVDRAQRAEPHAVGRRQRHAEVGDDPEAPRSPGCRGPSGARARRRPPAARPTPRRAGRTSARAASRAARRRRPSS